MLFRGLSFALERSEVLRISGANGSGKTSLVRILCGLLQPFAGEVRWHGAAIRSLREEFSKNLLYLGHAPAAKDDLTAEENLSIACRLAASAQDEKTVSGALRQFAVPENALLRRLSQGQRRRAALARLALSAHVPLWLLDEPFTALDAAAVTVVEDLVSKHAAAGGIVVYTTHQDAHIGGRVLELGGRDA